MNSPAPGQAAQPSPAIMSRLAFVRLFFQQGIDQSLQPEPLNVGSVLTLQDTAELFLQVVAEHRGIKLPRFVSFPEYWKLLDPAHDPNGVALSGERPMTRLNDLRTAFKHHGTLPSATAVAQACIDVRAFLEANTLIVFGMPFDTIDMAEVIPQAGVRGKVRAATAAVAGRDLTEAMGLLAEAYANYSAFLGQRFHRGYRASATPLDLSPNTTSPPRSSPHLGTAPVGLRAPTIASWRQ